MLLFDHNDGSLEWGDDQVMYQNDIIQDVDGGVRIELKPVINKKDLGKTLIVTVCAAGVQESEIQTRIEHLQEGWNVLIISCESTPRKIGEGKTFVFTGFQKSIHIHSNVCVDSMSKHFCDGLLVVSFNKV